MMALKQTRTAMGRGAAGSGCKCNEKYEVEGGRETVSKQHLSPLREGWCCSVQCPES